MHRTNHQAEFALPQTLPVIPIVIAIAALLRFSVLFFSPATIDATFLPDDTYYALSIARNIAEGNGPSTDGIILTSGFQPLFVMLLTPVFWLTSDPDVAMQAAVGLSALFGAINAGLAACLVLHLTRSGGASLLAGLLIATCPPILHNDLNGLETSLAAFTALLLLLAFERAKDAPKNRNRLIALGLAAGFAPLARIDLVFLTLALGAWGLFALGWARTLFVTGLALIVALPWIIYCLIIGGVPVPESGQAVRAIVEYNDSFAGIDVLIATMRALDVISRIVEPLTLYYPTAIGVPIFLGFTALAASMVIKRAVTMTGVLAIGSLAMLLFYVTYSPGNLVLQPLLPSYLRVLLHLRCTCGCENR